MSTPQQNPKLYIQQITDLYTRTNFQNLQSYFAVQNQLYGFNFFEINATQAVTNQTLNHNLGFTPKDILTTLITGAGSLSWNVSLFNQTSLSYSTTGACRVRFFVGTYWKDTSTTQPLSTDVWTIHSGQVATTSLTGVAITTGVYIATGKETLILASAQQAQSPLVSLPGSPSPDYTVSVKKVDNSSNSILVNSQTGASIDGASSFKITAKNQVTTFLFSAAQWYVISNYTPGD